MGTGDGSGAGAPVISVVIPAFNASSTLARQLEALSRNAMSEPWEVLVADNGSTDDTVDVARSWADRLPLRVLDASARRGPAAARNLGAASARSPYLAFCDADDVVADDWLPKVLVALRIDEFVAIGVRLRAAYSSRKHPQYVTYSAYASIYLPGFIACGAGHMAVRADVFRRIGGFDESMLTAEDHDFCYRVQLEGHPLVPHPEAMVTVNRRDRLIDVFRQQFRWGANDGAIRHKYERVRTVLERALAEGRLAPVDPRAVAVTPLGPHVARSGGVRAAVRSPGAFADLVARRWSRASIRFAERVAFRVGRWSTRTDPSRPELDAALAERYVAARAVGWD